MRLPDLAHRSARTPRTLRPLIGVAVVATVVTFAAATSARLRAATLPYRLDSLVFSADQIVEGTVVRPAPPGVEGVQVTIVEAGTLTVGQTIYPEHLFSRLKPGTGIWARHSTRLQEGDHVILFLKGQPPTLFCVDGGTFLAVRGKVFAFGKQAPMGTLTWYPDRLRHDSPTVREFRAAVAGDASRSAGLHALLDPPAKRTNAARMLSLLSSRATPFHLPWEDADTIGNTAATRLVELGDFEIAAEAVAADPMYAVRFRELLSSRAGRDYLMRRIADRSVPLAEREHLVPLLAGEVGFRVYYYNATEKPPPLPEGAPGQRADDFVGWVRLAGTTATEDERLAGLVLHAMEHPLFLAAHDPPNAPQSRAAVDNAEHELRALYTEASTSDCLKYWIECAMAAIGRDAYQRLDSPCGRLMTLAGPPDLTRYFAAKPAMLAVGYDYCDSQRYGYGMSPVLPQVTSAFLVLEPRSGGNAFVLPSAIVATQNDWTHGHGIDATPLPPGFPAGTYHVNYRLMNGNTVVSEGHGVDLQIPQQGLRVLPAIGRPVSRPARMPSRTAWRTAWTAWLVVMGCAAVLCLVGRRLAGSHRRIVWFQNGRCHACGYDLRASHGRCPECGTGVPKALPIQVLRRRLIGIGGAGMLLAGALLMVLLVRSFCVADVVTRTTFFRADAVYTVRGILAVQWLTIGSDAGWLYERADPKDLPTAAQDAGPPADIGLLGLEYSFGEDMLVLPLWIPVLVLAVCGLFMWRARKPVLLPAPQCDVTQVRMS